MAEVLTFVLVAVVVLVTVTVVVTAMSLRAVRRRNRVSRTLASPAPLHWVVDPLPAGRLHRRLRNTIDALRAEGLLPVPKRRRGKVDEPSPLVRLARELEAHAVAVDAQLAGAARFRGAVRREHIRALGVQVDDIEQLANRLLAEARRGRSLDPAIVSEGLARIAADLDHRDAAHAELAELERSLVHPPLTELPPPLPGTSAADLARAAARGAARPRARRR